MLLIKKSQIVPDAENGRDDVAARDGRLMPGEGIFRKPQAELDAIVVEENGTVVTPARPSPASSNRASSLLEDVADVPYRETPLETETDLKAPVEQPAASDSAESLFEDWKPLPPEKPVDEASILPGTTANGGHSALLDESAETAKGTAGAAEPDGAATAAAAQPQAGKARKNPFKKKHRESAEAKPEALRTGTNAAEQAASPASAAAEAPKPTLRAVFGNKRPTVQADAGEPAQAVDAHAAPAANAPSKPRGSLGAGLKRLLRTKPTAPVTPAAETSEAPTAEAVSEAVSAARPERPAAGFAAWAKGFAGKKGARTGNTKDALESRAQASDNLPKPGSESTSSKAAKQPKPARKLRTKAKGPSKVGPAADSLDILTELDGGRIVYWRVTATELQQLEEASVTRAASFSRADLRLAAEASLRFKEARDLALSELGAEARIINASRALGAVYATDAERIAAAAPGRILGPGLMLLEQLRAKQLPKADKERIVGLLLASDSGPQSVVVLYHLSKRGDISPPQISVNPDMQFVVTQFALSRRLDAEDTEVVLFKNQDLLEVARSLEWYPAEDLWYGIPTRKVLLAASVAMALAAAGISVHAAMEYTKLQTLTAQQAQLKRQVSKLDSQAEALIADALAPFAATQSLSVKEVTNRARQLWVPHGRVRLDATPAEQTYSLTLPFNLGSFTNNQPSVLRQMSLAEIERLTGMSVPTGCTKNVPALSGGMNVVEVKVRCQGSRAAVNRYRVD